MNFWERRRLELGLTLEQMAARLGCKPRSIRHWELGYRSPGLAHVAALAKAYQLGEWFIGREIMKGRTKASA